MQQTTFTIPVLAVNSGSSSLKLSLYRPHCPIMVQQVERIGMRGAPADHRTALLAVLAAWQGEGVLDDLAAVGHRVVHGGELFSGPVRITPTVIEQLHSLCTLAPLHNPLALQCIEAIGTYRPGLPQVACFDTAFHHGLPPHAFHYALPPPYYHEHGIRRYGFHGLSLASVCRQAEGLLNRPTSEMNLIVAHLGNGASMTAIKGGQSIETSMGFTPLEGLVMGSRSGDLDPAIPAFLEGQLGMSAAEVGQLLNHQSGLKGLCGHSDLREIHSLADEGKEPARLALAVYVHRIRKYLGAYTAVLGRVDALIFTAGVGEHDARVREAVCAELEGIGYVLDSDRNRQAQGAAAVHTADSRQQIWMIPTDEEGEIARQTITTIDSLGVTHE